MRPSAADLPNAQSEDIESPLSMKVHSATIKGWKRSIGPSWKLARVYPLNSKFLG